MVGNGPGKSFLTAREGSVLPFSSLRFLLRKENSSVGGSRGEKVISEEVSRTSPSVQREKKSLPGGSLFF